MDDIKIVRLQTGEDVIASYTTDKEGFVFLLNPMVFIVKRTESTKSSIFLSHWLPIDVLEKNVAQITKDDILCILEPTDEFKQYYFKVIFEEYHGEDSFGDSDSLIDDYDDYDVFEDDYTESEEEEQIPSILVEGNKTKH